MITIKGGITATNIQINENTHGDITMTVGISSTEVLSLVERINEIAQREGINDPELTALLREANEQPPETLLRKLQQFATKVQSAAAAGQAIRTGLITIASLVLNFPLSC